MTYLDLTHTFTASMPVYPGDPTPLFKQSAAFFKDGFNDFTVHTGMHVGTHMDGPLHMIEGGKKLCQLPPEIFFGRGVLIDARGHATISEALLQNVRVSEGDIVLFFTDHSAKFGQAAYFDNYPILAESLAHALIAAKVKMMGIDGPSPDRAPYPIHKLLLAREIPILENLIDLEALYDVQNDALNFEIIALPTKFDADSAPTRVIAKIMV